MRFFLIGILTGIFLLLSSYEINADTEKIEKPNIVFIMADDLGWTDLACYGSPFYETPHLDQLCLQGMKFLNAYSNAPNCQPTRAALLSGQYSPRHGVYTVSTGARGLEKYRKMIPVKNRSHLPADVITIAESLKKAGYQTGCFGKWHLGDSYPSRPNDQGFDRSVIHLSGGMGQVGDFTIYSKEQSSTFLCLCAISCGPHADRVP